MSTGCFGVCRTCDAPIEWVLVEATGSVMPVNPVPTVEGRLTYITSNGEPIVDSVTGVRLIRVVDRHHEYGTGPLLTSHFATCPDATEHRRRVRKGVPHAR